MDRPHFRPYLKERVMFELCVGALIMLIGVVFGSAIARAGRGDK